MEYLLKILSKYRASEHTERSKKLFVDSDTETEYSLTDLIEKLYQRIEILEDNYKNLLIDIKRLEEENVELTNALYESENRLQSSIDNIHPVVYNLQDYSTKDLL